MQNYSWILSAGSACSAAPLLAITEATLQTDADSELEEINRALNRLYFNLVVRARREAAAYIQLIEQESAFLDEGQKRCFFVPYVFASGAALSIQWRVLKSARGKLKATSRQISAYLKKSFKHHYGKSAFKGAPDWALPIILSTEKRFEGMRIEAEKLQEARRALAALAQGQLECRRKAIEAAGGNPDAAAGFRVHLPSPAD